MVAIGDIQELADRIARAFRPERIILFGSYAYGHPTPDSDVDLLIVMPHSGKSWESAARTRTHVEAGFPLDLLVRSPTQIRDRVRMGDPFLAEIVQRGRVMYEANHG